MKLKSSTYFLLGLCLVLGGIVYLQFKSDKATIEQVENTQKSLFDFTESDIQELTLISNQQAKPLQFKKTENPQQPWQLISPENRPVNKAAMAFLLDILLTGKSNRSFTVSNAQISEYGLNQPSGKIIITLKNNKTYQIILGKSNLENQFVYGQILSSKSGENQIFLLPKSLQSAIEREISVYY